MITATTAIVWCLVSSSVTCAITVYLTRIMQPTRSELEDVIESLQRAIHERQTMEDSYYDNL